MNQNARRMRPMGIADILDETVELYKTSFVLLVGIAAVMNVPYAIFERYFYTVRFSHFISKPGANVSPTEMAAFLGATILGILYLLVTAPIVTGALTYAISERYLGNKVTIVGSFRRVFSASVFGQLLLAIMIKVAVVVIPTVMVWFALVMAALSLLVTHSAISPMALLLGALGLVSAFAAAYLLLRLALVEPTIVVEMKGIGHSLSRTWKLMPGSMVKCFVLLLLSWVVTSIVQMIVGGPTQMLIVTGMAKGGGPSQVILIIHTLIGAISSTILAPVLSIVTILLYYDIRIRREGFDLELLASEMDAKTREIGPRSEQPLPQEQAPVEQAPPGDATQN